MIASWPVKPKGAPAAAATDKAVDAAIASVPRPDSPLNYAEPSSLPAGVGGFFPTNTPKGGPRSIAPYDWQRALVGGATDIASSGGVPETGTRPLGDEMTRSVKDLETPGRRAQGALGVAATGSQLLAPLAGPAALENPIGAAKALGVGTAVSKAGGWIAKKAGAGEVTQKDIENLSFWVPQLFFAFSGIKAQPQSTTGPSAESPASGGGRPAVEPPIPQPSDDPLAQAATALNTQQAVETSAARAVQGVPEPAPPPPPAPTPPTPNPKLAPEEIQGSVESINKLPPEARGAAILEMHQKLAEELLKEEKIVGEDGKVQIIKTRQQAETAAKQQINDAQDLLTKAVEETQRQGKEATPQTQRNPEENPIAQAKALPRETDLSDIDAFVKTNAPEADFSDIDSFMKSEAPAAPAETPNASQPPAETGGTRKTGRDVFTKGDRVQLEDGRKGTISFTSPEDPFVRIQLDKESGGGKIAKGISKLTKIEVSNGGTAAVATAEPKPLSGTAGTEATPKYKFGNTQANIPEESEAHRALESARARISPEDLAGKGADVGGSHVTVKYGIKGDDTERIKKYLAAQAPFEATLGKTESFPPSEHSDGAAVIKAPIEAPELHRLNSELEQHGEFTEPSFSKYKPHATIAYVKPEKAPRYVGMSVTHGKKFTVSQIAISKRDGSQEVVKLGGKAESLGAEPKKEKVPIDHEWLAERREGAAKLRKKLNQATGTEEQAAVRKEIAEHEEVSRRGPHEKAARPETPFSLKHPPEDIGIQQYVNALPEPHRDYAHDQWNWYKAGGPDSGKQATALPDDVTEDEADAIDHRLFRAHTFGLTTKPTIQQETEHAAGDNSPEGRRPVRPAEGHGRGELENPPQEASAVAGKKRGPRAAAGRSGGASDTDTESGAGQGTGAGPGEGTSLRHPAAAGTPARVKPAKTEPRNTDWFTHPEEFSVDATEGKRLEWNIRALKVLKRVQDNGDKLTDEDRNALAHYVGWGALQWAFDPYNAPYDQQKKWIEANRSLRELMTDEEFAAARRSTQNAHYTSPQLVRFVWSAMQRMGFKGGNVLEPSMGTGNFFGMMPKSMRSSSSAVGNELDPTTCAIARLLYPSATTFNKDFVDLMLPHDSVDLAIGNVPFGEKVYDKNYPKLKASVHDYFFVKALDKVRPGGIVAFITSTFTLDKQNAGIREMLADKGDLLFALRLPQDTFAKSSGTAVATDLIFVRKRIPGTKPEGEPFTALVDTQARYEEAEGFGVKPINQYFALNPENVLGDLRIGRGRTTANAETLVVKRTDDFEDRLAAALDRVPKNAYLSKRSAAPMLRADTDEAFASDDLEEGDYTLTDKGEIRQRRQGKLIPTEVYLDKDGKTSPLMKDRMKRLIDVRTGTRDLMRAMRSFPDESASNKQIEKAQLKLAVKVKEYQRDHGYFNERRTKAVFEEDSGYPLLLALEDYDKATRAGTPAAILRERTIYPEASLSVLAADPREALYQVLGERGKPDIEFMVALSGKSEEELSKPLVEQGLIFREPVSGQWQTRAKYLSGYVREKLVDAKKAVAQGDQTFEANVRELEKVQPPTVPINSGDPEKDIAIRLGATWIQPATVEAFIREQLGASASVKNVGGAWAVLGHMYSAEATGEFSGGGVNAGRLLELALNQQQPVVKEKDGGDPPREVVNQEKTIAAKRAQLKLKEAFAKWARNHQKWAPILEKEYNERVNNLVTPIYDGSHLTFPGMNKSVLRDGKLSPHQLDAVWRMIEEGRALLAHPVGAGKTYELIAAAMELKRLGRVRKPMFAVPNHLVGQWAADFLRLYPGAKILVPGKDDFDAVRRNKTMSRIATGNWDAIILPHSQFNLLDISPERQRRTLERDMEELEEAYSAAKAMEGGRGYTPKRLEKAKERLKAKIDALKDYKADKTIRFDDTGIDHLAVDEAHAYKNLTFYTKMERVAGLAQGDSKRATRLKMKTDYLLEKHGNRGVVLATGTPVQNTMAEEYNMTRYVAPDALEKAGIKFFDDWAANFGEVVTSMELSVDGRTYKARSKFSRFVNVPELQMMFRSFADIKTKEELNLPAPALEGGKPQALTAKPTPELEQYVRGLINRAKILRGEPFEVLGPDGKPTGEMQSVPRPDPREDNMLKLTGDGRKAATDLRLIDPDSPDDPQSKINKVVKKIFEEWEAGKVDPNTIDPAAGKPLTNLTGAVFLDNYQFLREVGAKFDDEGKQTAKGKEEVLLNLYRDMVDKLVALGIPRKDIAVIHDYPKAEQKTALFQAMNKGEVRILFGSTEKMGAGMNAQERMKFLIDVDSPWRPGDLEQRHGRILRQGNKNKTVRIYHAVTTGTFDSYMIQTLKTKAEFISQLMSGKFTGRTMTDVAGEMVLSLEEMLAASSSNPDVKRNMELQAEVTMLQILEREHESQMYRNRRDAEWERDRAGRYDAELQAWERVKADQAKAMEGDKFSVRLLGKTFDKYGDINDWLKDQRAPAAPFHWELNGVPMRFEVQPSALEEGKLRMGYFVGPFSEARTIDDFASLVTSANSYLQPRHIDSRISTLKDNIAHSTEKADKLEKLATKSGFEDADRLRAAKKELGAVRKRLGIDDEKAAAEQDVAAEIDSTPDGPEAVDEENDQPSEGTLKRLLKEETGTLDITALAEVTGELYKQDIVPILEKTGIGLKEVPSGVLRLLYPRIEHSNPIGRALGIAAPSDAVDALMKVQGDRFKALAEFDLILKGVSKMFDKLPDEARVDFINRIQTGKKQATSDLDDLATMFTKIMDGQREIEQEAANLGRPWDKQIQLSNKENYFHNWWETPPGNEEEEDEPTRISRLFTPRRPLEGSKGYNKRQSYTLASGIAAGGEPVTTNPVRILRHRIEDGMKFVTARQAWHEAHELDLRVFVRKGDRKPAGFDKIDDKIAKAYYAVDILDTDLAEYAKDRPSLTRGAAKRPIVFAEDIETHKAIIESGEWYLEANTARLLNNMLSVDKIRANAVGRSLMWLKMVGTGVELGLSPFHAVRISVEGMSSMMALGMQRAYNQGLRQAKPEQFLQGMKEMLASPAAPIALAREGAALPAYIEGRFRLGKIGLSEFGHVISGDQPHGVLEAIQQFRELRKEKSVQRLLKRYPDLDQLIDDMFQGGLVVGQHRDYQVKALGKTMMEAWTANNPLGAILRFFPTAFQAAMYPLFNVFIPSLKYSLFLRLMSEQAAEYARELESGTLTRATLARRVADSVENRFGELNFDTLFLNRSVKSGLQFLFRAATFKMGSWRELVGAAGGQSRETAIWLRDMYNLLPGGGSGGESGGGGGGGGAVPGREALGEEGGEKTFGEKVLPRLDMRMSFGLASLVITAMLGIIHAKLWSKKYPWEWLEDDKDLPGGDLRHLFLETIFARTGETDSRGKPVRVNLLTDLKEVVNAVEHPINYIAGSLATILGRGMDTAENRDFFGNYVYNPNADLGTKAKQIAKYNAPIPFVASNFERAKQQGLTTTAWLSVFGFPKSPSDLDFTPAEKLARSLKKHEPETPEELKEWRARREALENGTASRQDTERFLRSQRLTWLQRQVTGLNYGDALDVMDKANPEERAGMAHILDTKRKNALKIGSAEKVEELEAEHQR